MLTSDSTLPPKSLGASALHGDALIQRHAFKIRTGNCFTQFHKDRGSYTKWENKREYVSKERKRKGPLKNKKWKRDNLPDGEFKAIVRRMLTELGNRADEHSENINGELEI